MNKADEIAVLLLDVEAQLRQLGLWQQQPPSAHALASTQPFCVDTLSFVQWLQFIFLPKMHSVLQSGQRLPGECDIAPLAREYFKGQTLAGLPLVATLEAIDRIISGRPGTSPEGV